MVLTTTSNVTITPKQSNWIIFTKLYLFFFYFSGVYQGLILLNGAIKGAGSFVGLRQAILMSVVWLIPIALFPKITRIYSAITGTILFMFSLLCLGYFSIYQQEFSQSVLFVMFDTNTAEGHEFIRQYYHWWMLPAVITYALPPILLWKKLSPPTISNQKSWLIAGVFLIIFTWPFLKTFYQTRSVETSSLQFQTRLEPVTPWQILIGYLNYQRQITNINRLLKENSEIPPVKNLNLDRNPSSNTLVLVIGESTNRQRMSLYGYSRDTTPKLNSIKKDLFVFNNVFAARPYTIETLQQALTFADQEHPDLYLSKPSLLNIMKQAGYKTFWITNQQTLTKRNTILTTFSKQADEQVYLNNNRMQNTNSFDEVVYSPFEKALSDPSPKKMIVIHLLGTHMGYDFRYPQNSIVFKTREGVPDWLTNGQAMIYNQYDNAVYYNDKVIFDLINIYKKSNDSGFLLYFSDHGEEVFDDKKRAFNGRSEGNPSSSMYTVPFLIWASPQWQASHQTQKWQAYTNRPYSTSDLIHTWFDIAGISFDELDQSKSITSSQFKSRPLWIGDPNEKTSLKDIRKLGWLTPQEASQ